MQSLTEGSSLLSINYEGIRKRIKKDGKVVAEKWIPSILVSDPEATKYCLKLDVRKYYPSIVHDVLKAKYRELFKDEELIWLMDEIIDSISTCPATEENIEILQRLGVAVNIIIDDNGREFVDGVGILLETMLASMTVILIYL